MIDQLKDIIPYIVLSLITGIIISTFNFLIGEKYFIKLMIQIISGSVFYVLSAYYLRLEALNETINLLKLYKLKINNIIKNGEQ